MKGVAGIQIELTTKEFRRLLDLVYIGNWILNSTRGNDRFEDYDRVESKLFGMCRGTGMETLVEQWNGEDVPSRAFAEGGIHEAIMAYEDAMFFEILAQDLALRDMNDETATKENYEELTRRMEEYLGEFARNGTEHVIVELDED